MELQDIEGEIAQIKSQMAAMTFSPGAKTEEEREDFIRQGLYGELPIVPIGGDGGGMFKWDGEKKQIGAGGVMVGGHWLNVAASSENLQDGSYAVKVTLGAAGDTAQIAESGTDSDTVRYIPIYTVADGKVAGDMRWGFVVQCWEN